MVASINRVCCSITQMPYADGAFDTVYCISVLEHMPSAATGPERCGSSPA
jgi:2-polyprenyl-3-methyl-5-hydroxy-6-metoxy-1,4-benzoquinol methylase